MTDDKTAPSEETKAKPSLFRRLLNNNSKRVIFFALIISVVVLTASSVLLVYLCWFQWMPDVKQWGFDQFSIRNFGDGALSALKAILAIFGILFLAVIPFFPFGMTSKPIAETMEIFANASERQFASKIAENQKKAEYYESILEDNQADRLIVWANYSRIELEQYYNMGLQQARKSYNYSLIAMWAGFLIILLGIVTRIVEIPGVVIPKDAQVSILTISSGVVAEMISALFLWIYKSSITQLTYFYNRQIFIHNSLLAFEISKSMQNSEEAKKLIIEKIMDFGTVAAPAHSAPYTRKGNGT
jgi:hypothetical protein